MMTDEVVKIKGIKTGLLMTFPKGADFLQIEKELEEKLESGNGFFCRGTVLHAEPGMLTAEEIKSLKQLFKPYGVLFRALPPDAEQQKIESTRKSVVNETSDANQLSIPQVQQMVVVNRTLRGGQEIRTESSVMICGNVNPGAQIISGGSIDIRGTCRGMVHAGAFGDQTAFVVADHLLPTQIRIADFVARSPDQLEINTPKAERAFIRDGQIVIEPIER